MTLTGRSLIAGTPVDSADGQFTAPGALARFEETSAAHVDQALEAAEHAFHEYHCLSAGARAAFLDRIGDEISGSDDLIDAAHVETSLPRERLAAERARTVVQLRMFAGVVREGSWVDARIDRAIPDRTPLPRPDIRRMLIAIGPVAVFGASNVPLAFSVAGGDTGDRRDPALCSPGRLSGSSTVAAAGRTPGRESARHLATGRWRDDEERAQP